MGFYGHPNDPNNDDVLSDACMDPNHPDYTPPTAADHLLDKFSEFLSNVHFSRAYAKEINRRVHNGDVNLWTLECLKRLYEKLDVTSKAMHAMIEELYAAKLEQDRLSKLPEGSPELIGTRSWEEEG